MNPMYLEAAAVAAAAAAAAVRCSTGNHQAELGRRRQEVEGLLRIWPPQSQDPAGRFDNSPSGNIIAICLTTTITTNAAITAITLPSFFSLLLRREGKGRRDED